MEEQKDPRGEIDKEFQYYRGIIITLAGVIVTLSSSILGFIFFDKAPNLIKYEVTAEIFWFIAGTCLILSIVLALLSIYYVLRGYYLQANKNIGQYLGDPTPSFNNADKLMKWVLVLFLIGLAIGFIIQLIQYFKR